MIYPLGNTEDWSEADYQSAYADPEEPDRYEELPAPRSLAEPAGLWRTRDARVLHIADMTTRHLENAIALFTKAGWAAHCKIRELREELARR